MEGRTGWFGLVMGERDGGMTNTTRIWQLCHFEENTKYSSNMWHWIISILALFGGTALSSMFAAKTPDKVDRRYRY